MLGKDVDASSRAPSRKGSVFTTPLSTNRLQNVVAEVEAEIGMNIYLAANITHGQAWLARSSGAVAVGRSLNLPWSFRLVF